MGEKAVGVRMPDCAECKMEDRIEQLEKAREHNREEHAKFYSMFNDNNLNAQRHEWAINNISQKLDKIDNTLEEMKAKPEKNADKFTGAIISAIGSLVGTGIVAAIMYGVLSGLL